MPRGTASITGLLAMAAICLGSPQAAHAQAVKYLFEIGGKVLTIALEKKADLTVAVVAAAVWDGTKDLYGKAFASENNPAPPANVACTVQAKTVVECQGLGKVTLNIGKLPATVPPSTSPNDRPAPFKWEELVKKPPCGSYTLALLKDGCQRGLVDPNLFVTVTPPKQPSPNSVTGVPPSDPGKKFIYSFPALKQDNVLFRLIPPAEAAVPAMRVPTPEVSVMTFSNGTVYRGEIANGKPNGKGELRQPNGAVIVATFVNGLPTGAGAYRTRAGLDVTNAHFENGRLVGLYLCNGTSTDKFAAYAYQADHVWTAVGWFKLAPGDCASPITTALSNRPYFLRFQDNTGAAVYADTHRSFCVSSTAFETADQLVCPPGTEKRAFARENPQSGELLFELLSGG